MIDVLLLVVAHGCSLVLTYSRMSFFVYYTYTVHTVLAL